MAPRPRLGFVPLADQTALTLCHGRCPSAAVLHCVARRSDVAVEVAQTMTDAKSSSNRSRRIRFPRIDFVTVMVVVVILIILVFITSEMWMPHLFNQ